MDGFATVRAYVEAGLGPADDPYRVTYLLEHLGLTGDEKPDDAVGRRGAARGACPRHGAGAGHPAARRADQPSRPRRRSNGWRTSCSRSSSALVVISHDRRFLERVTPRDRLARPRPDAPARQGLCAFRGLARHDPGGGGARTAQARPPDRARGALAALRRHRAAQAQHAPARRTADDAPAASAAIAAPRAWSTMAASDAAEVRQAGDRGEGDLQELWRPDGRARISRPASSAATASAWSARTAPARRRC